MKIIYSPELAGQPAATISREMLSREMTQLECVPWPEVYDYRPDTYVNIAHDGARVYIQWKVLCELTRTTKVYDLEQVCEDSCCEFFCRIPGSVLYTNLEVNAIGTMTASRRTARRENVVRFTEEEFAQIERYTSLGREPLDTIREHDYTILLCVPMELLGIQPNELPDHLMANIYKCGDKTPRPHFVSMFPIPIPNPDFHCPEFFQSIEIEPVK